MAGHGGVRAAARTLLLILVCLLAAVSGLQIPLRYHAGMHTNSTPDRSRYRPGAEIAIDLGNTNSCVAGYGPGKMEETLFRFCIPSWVAFADDGTALVGEAAKNHADADPEAAIFGFKRMLGLRRNHEDEEGVVQRLIERVPYRIGAKNFVSPSVQVKAKDGAVRNLDVEEIASVVVAELKKMAEDHLGRKVGHAVVTAPQHFSDPSAWAAMDAGKIAGLDVVRTVSEPIAAAVAYGLRGKLREDGNALVLHVGGGTADASVVSLMDDALEILAHRNDPFLGGDDFDQRTVDYMVEVIKTAHGKDITEDRVALRNLSMACERAKKALSTQDHAQVSIESLLGGTDFSHSLSRQKFEELNEDLFNKIIALVERVMAEAELESKNEIDGIVLVGGSTMIPKIQRLVKDYFGGNELDMRVKPDEAVVLGAAALHVHSSENS
ncbi:luminal-binding protein-like [Panicum miliaceum]|uniref:Luminal-binding protein-like n=1 Tax=Panicum miliaceum TaxID=4540 RepID=A0A3L6T2N0_PANMI|nr:luminal-binding protein-like [Panicum miliaceum]